LFSRDDVAVFINQSDINLDRSMILGGDKAVGCSAEEELVILNPKEVVPFARDVEVDDFSLILRN